MCKPFTPESRDQEPLIAKVIYQMELAQKACRTDPDAAIGHLAMAIELALEIEDQQSGQAPISDWEKAGRFHKPMLSRKPQKGKGDRFILLLITQCRRGWMLQCERGPV